MEKQKGGELIGKGSYGCVFYPAIKCNRQRNIEGDMVSKIFFSRESAKEAREEIKNDNVIRKIPGYAQWCHLWDKDCLPGDYTKIFKQDHSIQTCLDYHYMDSNEFNKHRRMLQGDYAGTPLYLYMESKFTKRVIHNKNEFTKQFLDLMRLMKPLFIGLVQLNKHHISHNDIKGDNIMIDDDGCKYIDFGISCNYSDTNFFKTRSMSEFISDRIYPSYPYEFIYLYATKDVLEEEKQDKLYHIYRYLHDRYSNIHETIFKRDKTQHYLLSLINRCLHEDISKEKKDIVAKLDIYSLGSIVPNILCKLCKSNKDMQSVVSMLHTAKLKSYTELLKDMCDPDHYHRITPSEALRRYEELENLYINQSPKQICKTPQRRVSPKNKRREQRRRVTP